MLPASADFVMDTFVSAAYAQPPKKRIQMMTEIEMRRRILSNRFIFSFPFSDLTDKRHSLYESAADEIIAALAMNLSIDEAVLTTLRAKNHFFSAAFSFFSSSMFFCTQLWISLTSDVSLDVISMIAPLLTINSCTCAPRIKKLPIVSQLPHM